MKTKCFECEVDITNKDVVGLNKKLLDRDTRSFMCLGCLSEYFGCSEDDLLQKIEDFKSDGCTLFA